MKNIFVVILALLNIFCFASCSSDNNISENSYNELQTTYTQLMNEYSLLSKEFDNYKLETSDWITYTEAEKTAKTIISQKQQEITELENNIASLKDNISLLENKLKSLKEEITPLEIEESRKLAEGVMIFEDNNVKINYLQIGIDFFNDAVIFWVENKTDYVLTIQCDTLSLDGIVIDGNSTMSDDVAPKSKGKVYTAYSDGITNKNPSFISGQLRIIDFSRELFDFSYDAKFINIVL